MLFHKYKHYYIEKKLKNEVIQNEEFNVKESQCYKISVLMNPHQNKEE